MTIRDFKDFFSGLPDDTEMIIFNDGFEWYGSELMNSESWKVINGKLVFNFCNSTWNEETFLEEESLQS